MSWRVSSISLGGEARRGKLQMWVGLRARSFFFQKKSWLAGDRYSGSSFPANQENPLPMAIFGHRTHYYHGVGTAKPEPVAVPVAGELGKSGSLVQP